MDMSESVPVDMAAGEIEVDASNVQAAIETALSSDGSIPGQPMDQEKKIRREIANSNERRRMQSINAGFQSLRTLLPQHEGEKLSKAAILQQTAEYIYSLEQEKTRLLAQNCHLKRLLSLSQQHLENLQDPVPAVAATATVGTTVPVPTAAPAPAAATAATRRKRVKLDIETETKVIEHKVVATPVAAATTTQMPPIFLESLAPEPVTIVSAPTRLTEAPPAPVVATEPSQQQQQTIVIHTTGAAPAAPHQPMLPTTPIVPQSLPSSVTAKIIEAAQKQQAQQRQASLHQAQQHAAAAAAAAAPQQQQKMPEGIVTTTVKLSNAVVASKPIVVAAGSENPAFVVTGGGGNSKQNLDSIVEAIRHLEGDHLFNSSNTNNKPVDATVSRVPVRSQEVTLGPSASATPISHAQALLAAKQTPALPSQLTLQMENGKQIVMLKQQQ